MRHIITGWRLDCGLGDKLHDSLSHNAVQGFIYIVGWNSFQTDNVFAFLNQGKHFE